MLKRNLMSFAIIVSGLFLANQAYGQKEIVVWGPSTVKQQKIKSPRDVQTGQLIDTSTGEIVWVRNGRKTSNALDTGGAILREDVQVSNRPGSNRRSSNLFDVSTGEIVWARNVSSTPRRRSAVDSELATLANW